ncbi:UNVERIFIED_CONTAM: putative mitochondrial protein [Sesamum latifolium]|uniref:Mitochondrial protein n=1 Tax=Sesamum latifolium TaxID=2727402 RepID=A0AAW2TN13_9LAMI
MCKSILFADDTLMFCQASEESLSCLQRVLVAFEVASGLKINKDKSAVVFSRNVETNVGASLPRILGIAVLSKHDRYLGLPTVTGRSKKEIFDGLKERIWRKLNTWSLKQLSQAGRAVLLKAVLQTIPSYAMSCFRIPETLLLELESFMANFFWNCGTASKIHWVAWAKLCTSKEEGGLGFRRLKEFNLALLAKQAWRVDLGPHSVLNAVLKHKYFPNSSFFDSRLGSSPSYTWKSLWGTRDVLAARMRWRVGDGSSILIIGHPWIPRLESFQPICHPVSLPPDSRVTSLLTDNKDWNTDHIKKEFCPLDTESILDIKVHEGERDSLVWNFDKQGRFSVRSAYKVVMRLGRSAECSANTQPWDFIWCSKAPPRVILFACRCVADALLTTTPMQSRGVRLTVGCGSCGSGTEDLLHILLNCSLARLVWAVSGLPWGSIDCAQSNTELWLREVHRRGAPLEALDIVRQATRVMNCTRASSGDVDSIALVM